MPINFVPAKPFIIGSFAAGSCNVKISYNFYLIKNQLFLLFVPLLNLSRTPQGSMQSLALAYTKHVYSSWWTQAKESRRIG